MGFPIYDYRTDLRNILVTPQIRSRFLKVDPGPPAGGHTHDVGHEIFLVLHGRALFEIDGEKAELGPGQMCVALSGQMHGVSAVGDEPTVMYLSVTPHLQPTHTFWAPDGRRLAHRFAPSSNYDQAESTAPIGELVDAVVQATRSVAEAAKRAANGQTELAGSLKAAAGKGDMDGAGEARGRMYDALLPMIERVAELEAAWNTLAPPAGPTY